MRKSIHLWAAGILLSITVSIFAPVARGQILQTLYSFHGSDGRYPVDGLVQGSDGNFYGTTDEGGANASGTVFRITTSGALTTLVSFSSTNGAARIFGLMQGSDGNFYGTTSAGGTNDSGTVSKMTTNGALTTLVSFGGNNGDGARPTRGLVQGRDGNFYGTTTRGGASLFYGTVFRMTPDGALTTLVSFEGTTNGSLPVAGLLQGSDGDFYGTASQRGANGGGTVFRITTNGALTTLVSFNGTNGNNPLAGLVQGNDGNLYGTTGYGGTNGHGTVFRITTNGTLTTLVSFNGNNGESPMTELVQGSDRNFYGAVSYGGANGSGTVFKMTTNGTLTTLVSFNGSNGRNPNGRLVQGNDGYFYGTTFDGGANNYGTVFRIVPLSLNWRQSGNELILSWPTNAVGFTLQSSLNLAPSEIWIDFTNSPAVIDGQFTVTNLFSSSAQFYRLRKP